MANVDHLLPRVGERIGSYQLVQELGRGGFSVVFRAIEASWNTEVAIKLLAPAKLSPSQSQQLLQRFQQEARVAQKLQHPCAIKVRDFGQTPNGLLYLVTDFINGRVLTDVIRQGPLSVARTVRIASQVLGCLAEAHGLGIVHRDLKPDNIMLRDFTSEQDVVTVLDFGVAKVSGSRDGVVTQVGMTLGTPYYTAPEQCRGEKAIDGRADLYSLGLIIAECLTGRRVIGNESGMAAIYIQAGAQPLEFEPALRRSPLFEVIHRATEKPKEWRFADAERMREALELAGGVRASGSYPSLTAPIHVSAVHEAVDASRRGSFGDWTSEHGLAVSTIHPRVRGGGNLDWLWAMSALMIAGVLIAIMFAIAGSTDRMPTAEATTSSTPSVQPPPQEAAPANPPPVPNRPPIEDGRGPVRASVQIVTDEGGERRVTLVGCGFASGLLVGERAQLPDTGMDLEITRLRDDSHCFARTLATAAQVPLATEVVFPPRETARAE